MISYLPNDESEIEEYRIFSDVVFIVSDIDGTLTRGFEPIGKLIQEKTDYLKQINVMTTIATGRPYRGAYNVIQQLGITTGTPVVLYNGGVLLEHNTGYIIKACSIPFCKAQMIVDIVSSCGAGVYVYTYIGNPSDRYSNFNMSKLYEKVYYTGKLSRKTDINGNCVKSLNFEDMKRENIASILIQRREITREVIDQLIRYFQSDPKVSYTDSGSGFIEIRTRQTEKSVIIEELRCRFPKDCAQKGKILAIGDNENDVDLFKLADISVAVANSSTLAKKTADYLCKRECAEGYLDMLRVIENAKRYWKQ